MWFLDLSLLLPILPLQLILDLSSSCAIQTPDKPLLDLSRPASSGNHMAPGLNPVACIGFSPIPYKSNCTGNRRFRYLAVSSLLTIYAFFSSFYWWMFSFSTDQLGNSLLPFLSLERTNSCYAFGDFPMVTIPLFTCPTAAWAASPILVTAVLCFCVWHLLNTVMNEGGLYRLPILLHRRRDGINNGS